MFLAEQPLEKCSYPCRAASQYAIGGVALLARFFYATVYKGMANEGYLVLAAGLPLVLLVGGWPIRWITKMTPHTYDALLLWTDCGVSAGMRTWAIGHL